MSKSVIPFTAKLVKFDTEVPFAEVISRLNSAVNKDGSGNIVARLKSTNTQNELTTVVNDTIGDSDFLCVQFSALSFFKPILVNTRYFMEYNFRSLLVDHTDGAKEPSTVVYTIGNPLIAQKIMKHNLFAAYSIPPRLLILGKPDVGTTVSYYLPSSVMGQPEGGENPVLDAYLQDLDNKLETLVKRITKTSS